MREANCNIKPARHRYIYEVIIPSFASATARETFFSSLIDSNRLAKRGVTLPSTIEAASSRAVAALSNFWKFFNFILFKKRRSARTLDHAGMDQNHKFAGTESEELEHTDW